MSWIINGPNGREWHGSSGVFFSAFERLVPILRQQADAAELVERIEEAMNMKSSGLDLSDLLHVPTASSLWRRSIDRVLEIIDEEGAETLAEPSAFPAYRAKVAELREMALP